MSRPPKPRCVRHDPTARHFKPAGVPMRHLEEVGAQMNVSRATAGRILAAARRKTAAALVHGWAIRVEGGVVESVADARGRGCGRGRRRGRGPR